MEDIVRDGRLYASENHQEILKVSVSPCGPCHWGLSGMLGGVWDSLAALG